MKNTKPNLISHNSKKNNTSKLSDFMNAYCEFIEYGVRGWMTFTVVLVVGTLIVLAVPSMKLMVLTAILASIFVMVSLWSRDYALGYVPLWFYNPTRW